MDVLLTVIPTDGTAEDVRVTVDPHASCGELLDALGLTSTGCRVARTAHVIDRAAPVESLGLRDGDRLLAPGVARDERSDVPDDAVAFDLLFTSGPQAGQDVMLRPGEYVAGRDPSCDIVLDDDQASRRHLHLGVGSRRITVTDLGSTNGTFLDGRRLAGSVDLEPGQALEIGATHLMVERRRDNARGAAALSATDGRVLYSRPPRVASPSPPNTFRLPIPPMPPPPKKIPVIAALAPVLIGVVLFFVMGPVMLIFALLGPVMLFASLAEDHRTGRRAYRASVARFETEMAGIEPRVLSTHEALLADRRARTVSPAHVVRRVRVMDATLWERRPSDADFLTMRIGVGDLPTRLRFEGPSAEQLEEIGGDHATRLTSIREAFAVDPGVPVDADLRAVGVLGVSGPEHEREGLLRWLVTQAAVLDSPRDLAIVGLVPRDAVGWDWITWLPHTETLLSGVPGARSVAQATEDVRAVFQAVDDLIDQRRIVEKRDGGFGGRSWHPHLLLVIPGNVSIPSASLSRVLADGPSYGVSVIVGAATSEHLPGECRAIVRTLEGGRAAVTITSSGDTIEGITLDALDAERTAETARLLAPVRDVSASSASSEAPRSVGLLDALEMPEPTAEAVAASWERNADPKQLGAPVGVGPVGVFRIDLRRDGPHGLTAGTTGAGKSEFLQSFVGSLAATYPASRLTFVLVDYKGGAAFKDCVPLPHTVGFFTDLDSHLAERALVSLNAELRRREEVLREHGSKDLMDLERRNPTAAPANLLIVFDEFAFLKKEVPAFVAGVIDIAQRGRSLGVHLMLATQRPSGVVDDNIRANTNLRVALRMADDQDSNDVLDRPDAARIPKSLPGRAYVRVGHDVSVVQTAYGSGHSTVGQTRVPTTVRPLRLASGLVAHASMVGGAAGDDAGPTDLQRLVRAVADAHKAGGIPDQPHPWLEPLADRYRLDDLAGASTSRSRTASSDLAVSVGMVDLPAEQAQRPWQLDLGEAGHVLVYGTSGSGKTTTLRTLCAGLARALSPADLNVYGLDFGSRGLSPLASLPHCGGIVSADEPERIDALFALLERMVARRKKLLADSGAASLTEHRRITGDGTPYILVAVDNYGAFHSAYQSIDRGEQIDRFARLAGDGRAVGIHLAITADRRNAVPTAVASAVSERIVLRMADPDEYASLGLSSSLADSDLPPGRGFADGAEIQLAVVGDDPAGAAQTAAVVALGESLSAGGAPAPARVATLPDEVPRTRLRAPVPGRRVVPFGVSGTTLQTAWVDLEDTPVFAVVGPDRSGRTTALTVLVSALRTANPGLDAYLIAPRRSSLVEATAWTDAATGIEACERMIRALATTVHNRVRGEHGPPMVVVVDDGDELAEGPAGDGLAALTRKGRDAGVIFLAAVQTHVLHRTFGGWLTDLRKAKHAMLLSPDVDLDGELLGVRLPRRASHRFPPGRGFLIRRGGVDYVQVAWPGRDSSSTVRGPSAGDETGP